jgi:hypothetical protein
MYNKDPNQRTDFFQLTRKYSGNCKSKLEFVNELADLILTSFMILFKTTYFILFLSLFFGCTHNINSGKMESFIDLTIKYDNSLKSYKVKNNGEAVYLENKSGGPGVVFEGFVSVDHLREVDGILNLQAPFNIDTTIASWKTDENCADEPIYRLIYFNKYNKEIVFMGSSCVRRTAVDSLVFNMIKYLDSSAKTPYFRSFDKVVPPPPPF